MSLARLLPPLRASRPCLQRFAVARRPISQSSVVRAEDDEDGPQREADFDEEDLANAGDETPVGGGSKGRGPFRGPRSTVDTPYHVWLTGDGSNFRSVGKEGRNYLGGDHPFPLNPSFKPPIPVSDKTRTVIYIGYMRENKTVRELAFEHNISLRRVEAILRLKHLEVEWRKGQRLESSFLEVMEEALGVTNAEHAKALKKAASQEQAGEDKISDAALADFLNDIANPNAPTPGHVKMYFEPVEDVDGKEPFLDPLLQKIRQRRLAKEARGSGGENADKLVPRGDGKAPYHFVDVGNSFVDERDVKARQKRAERQRAMKAKKSILRKEAQRLDALRQRRGASPSQTTVDMSIPADSAPPTAIASA